MKVVTLFTANRTINCWHVWQINELI